FPGQPQRSLPRAPGEAQQLVSPCLREWKAGGVLLNVMSWGLRARPGAVPEGPGSAAPEPLPAGEIRHPGLMPPGAHDRRDLLLLESGREGALSQEPAPLLRRADRPGEHDPVPSKRQFSPDDLRWKALLLPLGHPASSVPDEPDDLSGPSDRD